ncbi:PAS sensor protein, partial [Halobacteriales archaeon QS_9_67_17]
WVNSFAFPLRDDDGEVYRFVGVIDDITEVKEQQLELGRHRDELERLNQINTVIRRVNQGLVQEKTREEIESQVCETLTNSKLYHAAWIGEAEGGRHIEPKAGAGIDVDVGEESLTVEEVASVATAVETGDVQIIQDVSELPEGLAVDAPTESGAPGGSQSFAAVIPLVYEETVYDVLVAYSARANAFGTREQAVLFELGKTIGLAINAVERKRALLTDEVLELELDVHDRDLFFVRASSDTGATFEMEGITSQSDGSYLQYFTVRGTEPERVLELAEEASAIEHARLVTDHEDSDACLVEFVVANSSLAPTLAEYGATVRTATFEDGEGTVVADLPRRADVRTTVEAVQSTFPDSTLVSKSRRERSVPTDRDFQVTLDETLTERQRTTLEAAYYAGFFDWPRDSSGEEVSETLDIAPATFHQHLRTGERKLVKTLVGEEEIA